MVVVMMKMIMMLLSGTEGFQQKHLSWPTMERRWRSCLTQTSFRTLKPGERGWNYLWELSSPIWFSKNCGLFDCHAQRGWRCRICVGRIKVGPNGRTNPCKEVRICGHFDLFWFNFLAHFGSRLILWPLISGSKGDDAGFYIGRNPSILCMCAESDAKSCKAMLSIPYSPTK